MRYLRLIIMAMFVSSLGTACGDFLDEKSQDEVIPESATDFREILLHYQSAPFTSAIHVLDDDVVMNEEYFSEESAKTSNLNSSIHSGVQFKNNPLSRVRLNEGLEGLEGLDYIGIRTYKKNN